MEAQRPMIRRKKALPAFYQPSDSGSMATQIMSEARQSLRVQRTRRPSTPADSHRILFGQNRTATSRPPSVYSIGARHFCESRPSTGQRLDPLEQSSSPLLLPPEDDDGVPPTPVQSTTDIQIIPHPPPHPPPSLAQSERKVTGGGGGRGGGGGGGTKQKKKPDSKPWFWNEEITPLLSRLSSNGNDGGQLEQVVDQLHHTLSNRDCYGRLGGVAGSRQRSEVLRAIFSLLDNDSPSLLMKLAHIIISMEVTGRNLLNVMKLLFSLARTETNDSIFHSEAISGPLVSVLGRCSVESDMDVLVYGLGTVKVLASNADLRPQLVESGALSLLQSLLVSLLSLETEDKLVNSTSCIEDVLVQLTAAMRNLLEDVSLSSSLLSSSLIPQLTTLLSLHFSNPTITFNLSRILSKLTLQRDCCEAIVSCPPLLPLLLQSLSVHHNQPEILVRICFILGNVTMNDDSIRVELCTTHNSLPPLTALFSSYFSSELAKVNSTSHDNDKEKSASKDILVKLVRLWANLSVEVQSGTLMASDETIVEGLLSILDCLPLDNYSELIVNTLATINNLSFHVSQTSTYLLLHLHRLSNLLVKILLEDNGEPLLECIRCYGNLSRHAEVRETITKRKVDEMMVTLLDSSRYELVFASCGVLVNLMSDQNHRDTLTNCGGVSKLLDVLRDFGSSDWQLGTLVCQILWNFSSVELTTSSACFGNDEIEHLLSILHTYLELPDKGEDEWREYFVPVATSLLDRVVSHHTPLVPLSQ